MTQLDVNALRPVMCNSLVRIGNPYGDGAYIMKSDLIDRCTHVLSLGLGLDWSFDRSMVRLNPSIRLIAADHTVTPLRLAGLWCLAWVKRLVYPLVPTKRNKAKVYRQQSEMLMDYFRIYGWGNHAHHKRMVAASEGKGAITIAQLFQEAGANAPYSVIVKMDIEGAEYDVLTDVMNHHNLVSTIAVEIHDVGPRAAELNAIMLALSKEFAVVHIHGNNCAPIDSASGFPNVIELTFVHKGLLGNDLAPSQHSYPRPDLDVPNTNARPDYVMRWS